MKIATETIQIENCDPKIELEEKIVRLSNEKDELLKQIEEFNLTKSSIEENIVHLNKVNIELKIKLEHFNTIQTKYKELNERFEKIEKDKDCLTEQLLSYNNLEYDLLESKELLRVVQEALADKCNEISNFVKEIANLKNEFDESCHNLQKMSDELKESKYQNNFLNEQYNQKNNELEVCLQERDQLFEENITLKDQIKEIKVEHENIIIKYINEIATSEKKSSQELLLADQKIYDQKTDIKIKEVEIEELNKELYDIKNLLPKLNQDIENQRIELNNQKIELSNQKIELSNLQDRDKKNESLLNNTSKEIEILNSEKNHYISQIEQMKIDSQSLTTTHTREINGYQETIESIKKMISKKYDDIYQMSTENKKLKNNLEKSIAKIKDLFYRIDGKNKENNDLSSLITERENQYEQISHEKKELLENNIELKNEIQIKSKEIDIMIIKYTSDLQLLGEKHKEEILEVTNNTLEKKNIEINELYDKNKKFRTEKENADQQINEMETKLAIIQENFDIFTHVHNEKQELLNQITYERDESIRENKILEGSIIELRKELEDNYTKSQAELESLECRHTEELQSLYDDKKRTFDQFDAQNDSQLEEISLTWINKLSELQEEINHHKITIKALEQEVNFLLISAYLFTIFRFWLLKMDNISIRDN